jgi:hypothetical protein
LPDDLALSVSDRAGTYEESVAESALNPFAFAIGEDAEYDWILQNNGATYSTNYCFQMAKAPGGAALSAGVTGDT